MRAPSFWRLLAAAFFGAVLAYSLWSRVSPDRNITLYLARDRVTRPDMLFAVLPLGAFVGIRLALGWGGTAIWTAMGGTWVLWLGLAWTTFRSPWRIITPSWTMWECLAAFLGAGVAVLWRAFGRLAKIDLRSEMGPVVLVGIAVYLGLLFLLARVLNLAVPTISSFLDSTGIPYWGSVLDITLKAMALIIALGSSASFAGNLDIPWGRASSASVLLVLISTGIDLSAWPVVGRLWHARSDWLPWLDGAIYVKWVLLEIAWFSWWAHRLVKAQDSE